MSITLNPLKWVKSCFTPITSSTATKKTPDGEKKESGGIFQCLSNGVKKLTRGNRFYVEINPTKWTKDDFSAKNITGFWTEKLNKIPLLNNIVPVGRYVAKFVQPKSQDIVTMPKHDASYVKFAYTATKHALWGDTINDNYELVIHDKSEKYKNGFEAFVQRSKTAKKIVISYKDTDDENDIKSDIQMAQGKRPEQLDSALRVYKEMSEKYPDYEIVVTGYSLGGSLTEMVCSSPEAKKHGNTRGFSFNGYGVDSNLSACGKGFEDRNNVICVSSSADIFVGNASHHVGKEYTVPSNFDIGCHLLMKMDGCIQNLNTDDNLISELYYPQSGQIATFETRASRKISNSKQYTSTHRI